MSRSAKRSAFLFAGGYPLPGVPSLPQEAVIAVACGIEGLSARDGSLRSGNDNRVVWDILVHNTIGTYADVVAYPHASDDLGTDSDEYVIPDNRESKTLGTGDGVGAYRNLMKDGATPSYPSPTGYDDSVDSVGETGFPLYRGKPGDMRKVSEVVCPVEDNVKQFEWLEPCGEALGFYCPETTQEIN